MCEAPWVCPKCSGYGEVNGEPCPVCNGERLIWPNPDLRNCVHTLKEDRRGKPAVKPTPNGPYSRAPCAFCGSRMFRVRLERHEEICLFNPVNGEEDFAEAARLERARPSQPTSG